MRRPANIRGPNSAHTRTLRGVWVIRSLGMGGPFVHIVLPNHNYVEACEVAHREAPGRVVEICFDGWCD